MEIVASNPCDQTQRPKTSLSPPRGLSAEEIRRLLAVIRDKPPRLRDRAIILTLTLTLTGWRRSEVLNLKAGDISQAGGLFYTYRGKAGKQGKRELPRPAYEAIQTALAAFSRDMGTMAPDESLWPSDTKNGRGVTSGTFYCNLRRYLKRAGLPPAGVHVLRHSAAKLRPEDLESTFAAALTA